MTIVIVLLLLLKLELAIPFAPRSASTLRHHRRVAISSRQRSSVLHSTTEEPPSPSSPPVPPSEPPVSDRLRAAQQLLEEYTSDFTPPPQFLLPPAEQGPVAQQQPLDVPDQTYTQYTATTNDQPEGATAPASPASIPAPSSFSMHTPSAPSQLLSSRWENGVKVATPIKTYNPTSSRTRYLSRPLLWLRRNVEIAFPLARWSSGVILDFLQNRLEQREVRY